LRDAVQGYGRRIVLDGLTIELQPGVTALLGPNAAGKSTLMKTLVTERKPRSGCVVIGGEPIRSNRARREARRHIGYLPQDFGYDPRFTVSEHVEYLAWLRGVPSALRAGAVRDAVRLVRLDDQRGRRLGALSGGSRQRAGIAGAIVGSPELLVLDEPTVGLDPGQRANFRKLVGQLPAVYTLISTHLTDDVSAVADRLVLLNDGAVLADTSVAVFAGTHGTVEDGYLAAVGAGTGDGPKP
jgi:ABC-2 type transport system ATP-binding protein